MSIGSFEYLFAFLPLTLFGYLWLVRVAPRAGTVWLTLASLVFYAWGGWRGLPYLLASVLFNFAVARLIAASPDQKRRQRLVWLGVLGNAAFLLAVKYAAFLLGSLGLTRHGTGTMPIGISFFTLVQVMYLMDCYEALSKPNSLLDHLLFSSFFPYVTLGPLVRTRDMKPLLAVTERPRFDSALAARGFELLLIGLFKKAVIAQSFAHFADSGWGLARPSLVEAWLTTLAFTFELYFDFSGYSDMAVGTGLLFGLKLPLNFDSPFKATSIIMFWKTWHMSFSAFITTYWYTPLLRLRRRPKLAWAMSMTVLSMTVAGLWHGAAWTFVVFGALHGVGLAINNLWRKTKRPIPARLSQALTFGFVLVSLVLFRAPDLAHAAAMVSAMAARYGISGFDRDLFVSGGPGAVRALIALFAGVACFVAPNSNAISSAFAPSRKRALAIGVAALVAMVFMNSLAAKEFIYRDF